MPAPPALSLSVHVCINNSLKLAAALSHNLANHMGVCSLCS